MSEDEVCSRPESTAARGRTKWLVRGGIVVSCLWVAVDWYVWDLCGGFSLFLVFFSYFVLSLFFVFFFVFYLFVLYFF